MSRRHEHKPDENLYNANYRAILITGVAILLVTGLAMWGGAVIYRLFAGQTISEQQREQAAFEASGRFPRKGPKLQITPAVDLNAKRKAEAKILDTYAWVDETKGLVRIPIERAMELIAEQPERLSP